MCEGPRTVDQQRGTLTAVKRLTFVEAQSSTVCMVGCTGNVISLNITALRIDMPEAVRRGSSSAFGGCASNTPTASLHKAETDQQVRPHSRTGASTLYPRPCRAYYRHSCASFCDFLSNFTFFYLQPLLSPFDNLPLITPTTSCTLPDRPARLTFSPQDHSAVLLLRHFCPL